MVVRPCGNSWEVHAPAKLNLHLEILARRTDGFHEIETLMVPVSLHDSLRVTPRADRRIVLGCRWAPGLVARHRDSLGDLPSSENNIVFRAVSRLGQQAEVKNGLTIDLLKRIPSQAGLGGASSDAAAALLAANAAWGLHWSRERLVETANEFGSDIAFFFQGEAAVCRGRGEQVEPVGRTAPLWFVLVKPTVGLSTPAVYKACRVPERPTATASILAALHRGDASAVGRGMMNRLQEPAEVLSDRIVQLREAFSRTACLGHQMSGSGSSYFGICQDAQSARRIAAQLASTRLGLVAWGVTPLA